MEKTAELSLANICQGAAEEVFGRELQQILANIADVNTTAESKRKITLEFVFTPFADRSGAQVEMKCGSRMVPVQKVNGSMFLFRQDGQVRAVGHDPRQAALFEEKAPEGVAQMKAKAKG